jgi:hypothetical protein
VFGRAFRLRLGSPIARRHFGAVSLNRCEDALLSYLRSNPDEQRFWHACVLAIDGSPVPREERMAELERALRAYAGERARADPSLGESFGSGHISLRNLAEYLLATWPPPRPMAKKPAR